MGADAMGQRPGRTVREVDWLEPRIQPSASAYAVIALLVIAVNATILTLSTLAPCGNGVGSRVCGFGISPISAVAIGARVVVVELAVFLMALRHFGVIRIGTNGEELVLESRFGEKHIPRNLVSFTRRVSPGADVTLEAGPESKYRGDSKRHIRVPVSMAETIRLRLDIQEP
jgi:hypothetical protein